MLVKYNYVSLSNRKNTNDYHIYIYLYHEIVIFVVLAVIGIIEILYDLLT